MSEAARSGFRTEDEVARALCNWREDADARRWIGRMGLEGIDVRAGTTRSIHPSPKADVLVYGGPSVVGISVKKFRGGGFNQIDKRWVREYRTMWGIPDDVAYTLRKFCGERGCRPVDLGVRDTRDHRRFFLTEMDPGEAERVAGFFNSNADRMIRDMLGGMSRHKADYILAIEKEGGRTVGSNIVDLDTAVGLYTGAARVTRRGSLRIGGVTVQRKGGDKGGPYSRMLQFKFSPRRIIEAGSG
ncbi:MAG: hypothetical protein MPI93_06125 [Nitrosopumilus sp.]|nr:hypothetical protein [Nitrosopumilus sp.]